MTPASTKENLRGSCGEYFDWPSIREDCQANRKDSRKHQYQSKSYSHTLDPVEYQNRGGWEDG